MRKTSSGSISPAVMTIFREDRIRCLFNVHSPDKKLEWTSQLDNTKLRLAENNNPGWYLQEESSYAGETAMLRRTLPLVANLLPLFIIEAKYSVSFSHPVKCEFEYSMLYQLNIWDKTSLCVPISSSETSLCHDIPGKTSQTPSRYLRIACETLLLLHLLYSSLF